MKKLFVILAAVGLLVASTVPAMAAAEWSFYGSVRMSTFWDDTDFGNVTTTFYDPGINANNTALRPDDDGLSAWGLQGNSRIGAKVKAGDIGGRFEYGHGPNPSLRLLFGTWNFGSGTLLIGQDYTPTTVFISNQVYGGDWDLLNVGTPYRGRNPQIKLKIGGFQLALIEPDFSLVGVNYFDSTGVTIPAGTTVNAKYDYDYNIPEIAASYTFSFGPIKLTAYGGYLTYDEVGATVVGASWVEQETSIDAYVYGASATANMGPFYLKGDIAFGQNWNQYGLTYMSQSYNPIRTYDVGTNLLTEQDADDWCFALVAGFKVNDMLSFEAGYGYTESEQDANQAENTAANMYLQATINIAKGFFIVPEIGKVDYKDIKSAAGAVTDQGDVTYAGMKWQINF